MAINVLFLSYFKNKVVRIVRLDMNNRQKRLIEVYDHVRTYYGVHTQGDFADAIGYSRPVVSSALNGSVEVKDKMFHSINRQFPSVFNLDYLLKGEGCLLTTEESVTRANVDERLGRTKSAPPSPAVEIPASLQELLDRAIAISRRNEELVDRLAHAVSDNKQLQITMQSMADQLQQAKSQSDHMRCELLTAVESINRFREQVDTMRHENESLKSSNTLLGKRLDKAAELFQQLNNQVVMLLNHTGLRYADVPAPLHQVNEPNVSPHK